MSMNDKAILARAKALVEEGWTQGTLARDEGGQSVEVDDGSAETYCALGACKRAVWELGLDEVDLHDALFRIRQTLGVMVWGRGFDPDEPETTENVLTDFNDADCRDAIEVSAMFADALID